MKKGTIAPIFAYAERRYPKSIARAMEEFFEGVEPFSLDVSQGITQSFIGAWFVYEYTLKDGRSPLQSYAEDNPDTLPKDALAVYRTMRETVMFDFFEIQSVDFEQGMLVRSSRSGREYYIHEKRGTHDAEIGMIQCNWLIRIGDHWEFASDTVAFLPGDPQGFRRYLGRFPKDEPLPARETYLALARVAG